MITTHSQKAKYKIFSLHLKVNYPEIKLLCDKTRHQDYEYGVFRFIQMRRRFGEKEVHPKQQNLYLVNLPNDFNFTT